MCSSILSAVMGAVIIILYSIFMVNTNDVSPCFTNDCERRKKQEEFRLAISVTILALGVTEFVIGVWAAICCCLLRPCACCSLVLRVIHHPNPEVRYLAGTPHPFTLPSLQRAKTFIWPKFISMFPTRDWNSLPNFRRSLTSFATFNQHFESNH